MKYCWNWQIEQKMGFMLAMGMMGLNMKKLYAASQWPFNAGSRWEAKSDHGRFVHLHTFSEKLLWSPGTHGNAGAGQNAALRLPLSFTAGALYAPSARLVCSLNVWDCANVLWSDLVV